MENINISEIPGKWVIIELKHNDNTYYKVFGTWVGGYLDGDRWKLNSGIKSIEQDADFYYFIGFSGSCYKCRKKAYGVASSFGSNILNNIIKSSNNKATVLEDRINWGDLIEKV